MGAATSGRRAAREPAQAEMTHGQALDDRSWPRNRIRACLQKGQMQEDQASELFHDVQGLLRHASPEELERMPGCAEESEEAWAFLLAMLAGGRRILRGQVCETATRLATSRGCARALRSSRSLRERVSALPMEEKRMLEEAMRPEVVRAATRRPSRAASSAAAPGAARGGVSDGRLAADDVQRRFLGFSERPRAPIGGEGEIDPELAERLDARRRDVERRFHEVVTEVAELDGPRPAERAPGNLFVSLRQTVLHIRALNAMSALENERAHASTVVAFLVSVAINERVKRRQVFEVMRILEMDAVWAEALRSAWRSVSPKDLDDLSDDIMELIGAPTDPSDAAPKLRWWASLDGDQTLAMAPALSAVLIMALILCLRLARRGQHAPSPRLMATLCTLWALPVLLDLLSIVCSRRMALVVRLTEDPQAELAALDEASRSDGEHDLPAPRRVLMASVEHDIIWDESNPKECRCKVVAGGLGKVAGMMSQLHPGSFTSVHPCMPGRDYEFADRAEPLYLRVDGEDVEVEVRIWRPPFRNRTGPPREFYLLDHQIFREREVGGIYPCPQTVRSTLRFWALWSQAVAVLIKLTRAALFHCPDFHTAMAVMYLEEPVPVVVVLHNAEYQGIIATQQIRRREIRELSQIFCLAEERIRNEALAEGAFSMIKPVVEYVKRYQMGFGICAVSKNYALEAIQKHAVFWGLPLLVGIENCMPEGERPAGLEDDANVSERRRACKLQIQQRYGLNQDPDARIFVFLGRWVKQKGLDYIADTLPWVLQKYSRAQFVVIGPVGDAYGSYARHKLLQLMDGAFRKQLFVKPDFMAVGEELKFACDYCIMPSRDEPFGYVDIEFGWYGAVTVGALRGGLGKMPGFYFQIFNADSAAHMQSGLKAAIKRAMECDEQTFDEMSRACRRSTFPVAEWQSELLHLYSAAAGRFEERRRGRGVQRTETARATEAGRRSRSLATLLPTPDPQQPRLAGEFLVQEPSEQEVQDRVQARLIQGPVSSAPALLEEVEWGLQLARETDRWAARLGRPAGGAVLIDWVLAAVYTSGPVLSVVLGSLGGHSDTGVRAGEVQSLFQALFVVLWTLASRAVAPNLLMVAGVCVRLLTVIPGMFALPVWAGSAILGFVAGADPLFVYFNFMGSAVGDVAKLSVRTGLLMSLRHASEPLGSMIAEQEHVRRALADPVVIVPLVLVFTVPPVFALLHAPIPYHEFRLPVLDFRWLFRQKFLPLLFVSQVMRQMTYVMTSGVLQVRGLSTASWQMYAILAAIQSLCCVACGLLASGLPTSAIIMVRVFACFSLPSVILQAFLLMEANGADGLMTYVDGALMWCYALDAVAAFACGAAVATTAGTRWRFITFVCAESVVGRLARAASPSLLSLAAVGAWPPREDSSQRRLAGGLFDAAYGPCLVQVLVMLLASAFLEREATGQLWTWRQRRLVKRAVRGTSTPR